MRKNFLIVCFFSFLFSWFFFFSDRSLAFFSGDDVLMTQIENNVDSLFLKKRSSEWTEQLLEKVRLVMEQYRDEPAKTDLLEKTLVYIRQKTLYRKNTILKQKKKDFVEQLWSGIVTKSSWIPENCLRKYSFLNQLGVEQDFPTALIVATWWKEWSCRMSLPANGYGVFQITSHDYGTGDFGGAGLREQAQHFIDFARAKAAYYDKANLASGYTLELNYGQFDYRDLRNHAVLYNAISWTVRKEFLDPRRQDYVIGNLWSGANVTTGTISDGLVTRFVKLLEWEVNEFYE